MYIMIKDGGNRHKYRFEWSTLSQVCCLQDQAAHVRRALLRKIHHYLKDRSLNLKYASAYVLSTVDTEKDIALEVIMRMFSFSGSSDCGCFSLCNFDLLETFSSL